MDEKLTKLIELSRELANPAFNLAILGEGNTSADCEDGTFWVKASGSQLSTITESGFSRVQGKRVLELLDDRQLDDAGVEEGLKSSLVDSSMSKPSVETFLHALCIYEGGIKWIGHTHPISVMSILCSKEGARPFTQHIYPDEIVGCGEMPAVVPYLDPGLTLAHAVRDELRRYLDKFGYAPKLILMENHGMVALGQSPTDVMSISLTADKWACTLLGTFTMGGPRFLTGQQAKRIETRPDEAYRRKQISMES
ncbi:MAG: class II aldolase/adducin family protein [Pelolinea sp.]|nr:class II aldolase/adducin family protein [Pelolinea sp.]